ncbi:hypothetical protein GBA52_024602 [Prunus armeniaca]|nr:hypothetical protein GBA52_024602 [Prunus armeniaca]
MGSNAKAKARHAKATTSQGQGTTRQRKATSWAWHGNIMNCTWCAQASCMGARFRRKAAGPVRCRLRACQASNSLTFSKWLE